MTMTLLGKHKSPPQPAPTAAPVEETPPTRTETSRTDSSVTVIPNDVGDIGVLLVERLRAWKHAVSDLQAYVGQTQSLHKDLHKEYLKVLKTIEDPLRQGHHFDQTVGGIASLFETLRSDTTGLSNSHGDCALALKSTVLPILDRLHKEIKDRSKHVTSECEKATKVVAKTRNSTNSQLELLAQHSAAFSTVTGTAASGHHLLHHSNPTKPKPEHDPFIIKTKVLSHLSSQVAAENTQQSELLSVQEHFGTFEAHIVATLQHAITELTVATNAQSVRDQKLYSDILSKSSAMPGDFEWTNFLARKADILIPRDAPQRRVDNIRFPNEDHPATTPVLQGTLQRKGKIMRSYSSSYYVLTPSRFLHEYKSADTAGEPEMSLFLPDCSVSAIQSGTGKFTVTGKGKIGKHEYAFKPESPAEGERWHREVVKSVGLKEGEQPPVYEQESGVSSPVSDGTGPSPVEKGPPATASPVAQSAPAVQTNAVDEKSAIAGHELKAAEK